MSIAELDAFLASERGKRASDAKPVMDATPLAVETTRRRRSRATRDRGDAGPGRVGPRLKIRIAPRGPRRRSRIAVHGPRAPRRQFFKLQSPKMSTWARPSKEPIMERLIVIPLESKPGRFSARLESTGEVIVTGSKQPLVGWCQGTACPRLRSRHASDDAARGQRPRQLPTLADRQVGRVDLRGGRDERPCGASAGCRFPLAAGTQKSTSELSGVPEATPEQKRLYEATFRTAA